MAPRAPGLSAAGARQAGPLRERPLARDTLWSLLAIVLVGGSTAIYSALVGRLLGETALGRAGLALALGLGGAQVATAGLAPALTRFVAARRAAGDPAGLRRALGGGLGAALALGLLLAALLLGAGPRLEARFGLPAALTGPVAALLLLQCLYIAAKAALYGLGRVGAYARSELPAGLAFGLTLALVLLGLPLPLIAPFLAANGVFAIPAAWLLVQAWPAADPANRARAPRMGDAGREPASSGIRSAASEPPPARAQTTPEAPSAFPSERDSMRRYTLIASLGSAAALARLQLALPWTAALWPAAELGRLQAALTFLPPVLLLPRALELALLPRLAGDWGGAAMATFRRRTALATRLSAFGLSLAAGGLALAAGWLLPALFGPAFAPAVPALRWTLLAAWALGLSAPAVTALSGADGVRVPNAAGVLGLLTSALAWAAWIPAAGATGAAAGLAAGSLVNAALPLAWAGHRYGLDWRPTAWLLARAGLLLVLSAAALIALQRAGASGRATAVLPLLIGMGYVILLVGWEGRRLLPALLPHHDGGTS